MKKFKVILCDVPWSYSDKCSAGKRGAFYKYPLMTLDQIKSIPVASVADDDCALCFWVTFPKLDELFPILEAWGFKYKTVLFNWVKMNKKQTNTLFWAMGRYTRSNSEICILATKGKPKRVDAGVHSVIMSPVQKHSQKPVEAYERIEKLFGDVPRLELFARNERPGWDSVGYDLGRNVMDIDKIDFGASNDKLSVSNTNDSPGLPEGTGPIIQNDN